MKAITFTISMLIFVTFSYGQGLFDASIHTAVPVGDVDSPFNESSQQVIDQDPQTKYLDFLIEDGIGFEVNIGTAEIATSMRVVTANDAPERDPTDYEIFGSNNGTDYTSIATGTIPCVADRFLARNFTVDNTDAYSIYRIIFSGTCNTSTINQVADVQLFVTTGNAPVLTCPDNLTVSTDDGQCSGTAEYTISATDVEDGTVTPQLILGLSSGEAFPLGTSPIVFTVSDTDNNAVSCEFFVTVEDTELPQIECSEDISVNIAPDETSVEIEYDVIVTDNCSFTNIIDGFTALGTIDGKSYYVSDSLFTPEDAAVHAFENGGVVGTIRSQDDNDYILSAIGIWVNEPISVLIGLSDQLYEGSWIWASGDGSTYTNWNDGEPNNSGPGGADENYVVLLNNGFWNDVTGAPEVYRYLLERDYAVQQTLGLESGDDFPIGVTTNAFAVSDVAGNTTTCTFEVTVDNTLSVDDQILTNALTLAPNPTLDGRISITNESNIVLEKILVYDIYGKLIHSEEINLANGTGSFDIPNLANGVYLMELKSERGTAVKKLVKE